MKRPSTLRIVVHHSGGAAGQGKAHLRVLDVRGAAHSTPATTMKIPHLVVVLHCHLSDHPRSDADRNPGGRSRIARRLHDRGPKMMTCVPEVVQAGCQTVRPDLRFAIAGRSRHPIRYLGDVLPTIRLKTSIPNAAMRTLLILNQANALRLHHRHAQAGQRNAP
jgi:hypothetical protein